MSSRKSVKVNYDDGDVEMVNVRGFKKGKLIPTEQTGKRRWEHEPGDKRTRRPPPPGKRRRRGKGRKEEEPRTQLFFGEM